MSEHMDDGVLRESVKEFETVKYSVEGGFRYVVYFSTEQAAAKAITDFWNLREKSGFAQAHLLTGMFKPIKHATYTEGDRTHSYLLSESQKNGHPGMQFMVEFNGNEGAIRDRGEEALRKLGFIE